MKSKRIHLFQPKGMDSVEVSRYNNAIRVAGRIQITDLRKRKHYERDTILSLCMVARFILVSCAHLHRAEGTVKAQVRPQMTDLDPCVRIKYTPLTSRKASVFS